MPPDSAALSRAENDLSLCEQCMHKRLLPLSLTVVAVSLVGGCPLGQLITNNTAEIDGNISIVYNNETQSRAIFSHGTWNELDRSFVRGVNLQPLRVPANTTTTAQNITCARNFAVATQQLVDWVALTEEPEQVDFDAAALNATVFFSDEAADTIDADVPTAGTAVGIELLAGVDFSCGDRIIVSFVEDPDQPGGFRIDYEVIKDFDNE
jgi:hypothetical protein